MCQSATTSVSSFNLKYDLVLILVLMDVPIGQIVKVLNEQNKRLVLILVLMDVPIGLMKNVTTVTVLRLNPCFNGCANRP